MKNREIRIDADLVIAGGGIPGICAAVQAARLGLKTALINNRTHFGGNGSAELMISICGATGMQEFNFNARETGVIEELLLENLKKNPRNNRWVWDGIILDMLCAEENIQLFPNTCIDETVTGANGEIVCICGTQNTTETKYVFYAPLFMDDTGDGTVAYLSGAEYRYGREGNAEFGERIAPEQADDCVIPSTMVFSSEKRDCPVEYKPPAFATDFSGSDVFQYREIPKDGFDHFLWFYEIDGVRNQIYDAETILAHHREFVYGIWDYIKNSGKFDAANHELSYVSPIMGKRESRRIMGDYILTEQDVAGQTDFVDTVGHGGWSIDLHAIDGFYAREPVNRHVFLNGIYQIPFRCGYSKDVGNLFLTGRCMSASHVAFGSLRVMATLATVGQANASAAFLCKKYGCNPRGIYRGHMEELQQLLLRCDQYIVGKPYKDEKNLARDAKVIVSSERLAEYSDGADSVTLDMDYGLSVPVIKRFRGVAVYARAKRNTAIEYAVFRPSKPENYDPYEKLYENRVAVLAEKEFRTVELPTDLELESGFYFIWISKNVDVELKCGQRALTEAVTSYLLPVQADNYIDLKTLEQKTACWKIMRGNLCFAMTEKEPIFAGKNLKNGFARPYRLPNVWQSKGTSGEYIELKWEMAVTVSELVLIFDSELTEYLRNARLRGERVRPTLVRDYDVEVLEANGAYVKLCEIRDNYQRVNRIKTEPLQTTAVRIRFLSTNGQPYVSVFDVRVYGDDIFQTPSREKEEYRGDTELLENLC